MSSHTLEEPVNILLVEDNPGDVRLTREAFESVDSEIRFHVLSNGKEATEYFHPHCDEMSNVHPDLILLDLNLPRIDGFAVLETLDKKLDYPPPPVLVLSSSEADEDILKSYEHAANAYLTKPNDIVEFNSMAQAIEDFWINTVRHPPALS